MTIATLDDLDDRARGVLELPPSFQGDIEAFMDSVTTTGMTATNFRQDVDEVCRALRKLDTVPTEAQLESIEHGQNLMQSQYEAWVESVNAPALQALLELNTEARQLTDMALLRAREAFDATERLRWLVLEKMIDRERTGHGHTRLRSAEDIDSFFNGL
ncbi:MAG: hypothetical protein VX796_16410 [Pseudomonadota bacterium]|nr:hypothetical protein [Pseudomonadota bacterium]